MRKILTTAVIGVAAGAALAFGGTGHASAAVEYAGVIDGYPAWEYGPFATLDECQQLVDGDPVNRDNPQWYPTDKFGTCYLKDDGRAYFAAAVEIAA
jgi:hypothetical protein